MVVLIEYNFIKFFIFLSVLITYEINTSEIIRPRGVSISRASLYHPTADDTFVCFDGSLTIPYVQVNDDYCDCRDGSDEPGTAACPNGVFHCTNAGHKSLNIPSSRVNDGICDCCDGSDEFSSDKCVNTCIELGQSARIEAQKQAELQKAGSVKRVELIQHGKQVQLSKKERYEQLQKHKYEAEQIKAEKEDLKKQAEELETAALEKYRAKEREAETLEAQNEFNKLDSNQNGIIEVDELRTRAEFDSDKNGEVSVEEATQFLNDSPEVEFNAFFEHTWPKIKSLSVGKGLFIPPSSDGENKEEPAEEDEEEGPEQHNPDDDAEHVEEPEEEVKEEQEQQIEYDEETQNLINHANEAREEFNNADRAVRDIEVELNEINDYLEKDFGVDNEFITLFGQCYEFDDDREYIYKLCPFDKALQISKSSGSETKLGVWSGWSESNTEYKYSQMFYNHGTSCWNGPQRTTRVYLSCGVENQVVMVNEPNRCEYEFNFVTPAICFTNDSQTEGGDEHDEL